VAGYINIELFLIPFYFFDKNLQSDIIKICA